MAAKVGNFVLDDATGKSRELSDFDGQFVVIFFYPKDSTPGCTIEAKEFSKALPQFKRLKADVVGISGGDTKSKEKFCSKHGLKVTLLSDEKFAVAKSFGAYGEKTFMGRKFKGIHRKTFILDKQKAIVKIFDKVKPLGHAEEVLAWLREEI